jgi:hypothetical protein
LKRFRMVALTACFLAVTLQASAQEPLSLYQRFRLPDAEAWGEIAVDLSAGQWRVGAPDGPPATEEQIRSTLGEVGSLVIAGRCASTVDGPTSYPCSLAVRELRLGEFVGPLFRAPSEAGSLVLWGSVEVDVPGVRAGSDPASAVRPSRSEPTRRLVRRFTAVRAPSWYLGDHAAAYGKAIRFSIRAAPNSIAESFFEPESGLVILQRRPAPVEGNRA